MSYDFAGLNERLLTDFYGVMEEWLPGGRMSGREYVTAGMGGGAGRSLSVNHETGKWADFATGDKGGDLISLWALIRGVDNGEAYRQLGGEVKANGHDIAPRQVREEKAEETAHPPPNVDFEPSLFRVGTLGTPSKVFIYRNPDTSPIFVVCRYETHDGKVIMPWIWNGLKWVAKAHPKPRPLYGLDRLAALNNPVLLVEGEKTADAAQHYFPTRPCLTWCGGTGQAGVADWAPLEGRAVTIWPDNDAIGKSTGLKIAGRLAAMDCKVIIIDPLEFEEGWDLADALKAGTPKADLLAYAKSHSREVTTLQVPEPKKPKAKAAQAEYQQKPVNGSMYETWQRYAFVVKSNGRPYSNEMNVGCAIEARGDLDIYYDEFSQQIMSGSVRWSTQHTGELTVWLQRHMGMPDVGTKTVQTGVEIYALARRRNALTQWLHGLEWDGHERVRRLMHIGFGTSDSNYTREVGRCFMISLVARAITPGCKADCMPVFEGRQGVFKSSALSIIGGDYFVEIHESVNHKDFYIALRGKLLGEISEMESFSKADIRKVKGIITTRNDTYRKPYDREAADHPRACLFAGTTNSDDWNTDETGARRFWPIRCGVIDLEWLRVNRDQLFAEALHRFQAGEDWWKVPEDAAERQREARLLRDAWDGLVMKYCETRTSVTMDQIIQDCLELEKQHTNSTHTKRVAQILRSNGWITVARYVNGKSTRKWIRQSGSVRDFDIPNSNEDSL